MALKNIILFTGTQRALASAELARWAEVFASKHGTYNISRFSRTSTLSLHTLPGEIASPAFGFAARLVVVEGLLGARPTHLTATEDTGLEATRTQTLAALKNCPESNFVLFWDDVTEKSNLADWLAQHATIKRFDALSAAQAVDWVAQRLPGADAAAARTLLNLHGGDLSAAQKDAFGLSLWKPEGTITEREVREFCSAEANLDEWALSNALETLDGKKAIAELTRQVRERDPLMILASCMGMLNLTVFALTIQQASKTDAQILATCALTDKKLAMVRRRIQCASELEALYARLVDLDWSAKTGRVPGGASLGALAYFEKILADLIPA